MVIFQDDGLGLKPPGNPDSGQFKVVLTPIGHGWLFRTVPMIAERRDLFILIDIVGVDPDHPGAMGGQHGLFLWMVINADCLAKLVRQMDGSDVARFDVENE